MGWVHGGTGDGDAPPPLYRWSPPRDRLHATFEKATYRYDAACAAALAASGRGTDAAELTDEKRAGLRSIAIGWLRDDLSALRKRFVKGELTRPAVISELRHALQDSDLSSIRDAASVTKFAKAERAACGKLWQDYRGFWHSYDEVVADHWAHRSCAHS